MAKMKKDAGGRTKADNETRQTGKGGKSKVAAVADPERARPEEPEVLPPAGTPDQPAERAMIVRRAEDTESLARLEASIQRDISLSGKLDKAGAMVAIKIGLALESAKALLRHGEYENWMQSRFGNVFSERKGQYYAKLAKAFLHSDAGSGLLLPPPREAGNWLVVADEGSALHGSVEAFVGDMTIGELLDKHGVRPARQKGGYRPAEWLVKQYQGEHPHLANKAFDLWPKEDREAFIAWQAVQVDGDDSAAKRMAAEGTWQNVRALLADHGLGRKTYALIPREQLAETRDLLAQVFRALDKALKE
jgi:hypothetical protein